MIEVPDVFTPLSFGGKTYQFRITLAAVRRFREKLGCTLGEALDRLNDLEVVEILLWACLVKQHPELTPEIIVEDIDFFDLQGVADSIAQAINNFRGPQEKKPDAEEGDAVT